MAYVHLFRHVRRGNRRPPSPAAEPPNVSISAPLTFPRGRPGSRNINKARDGDLPVSNPAQIEWRQYLLSKLSRRHARFFLATAIRRWPDSRRTGLLLTGGPEVRNRRTRLPRSGLTDPFFLREEPEYYPEHHVNTPSPDGAARNVTN